MLHCIINIFAFTHLQRFNLPFNLNTLTSLEDKNRLKTNAVALGLFLKIIQTLPMRKQIR